jgi:superfamily II DNA or RNA helicase
MKTLFPKQKEAHDFFVACHKEGRNTLDSSHVGTGKTVVACQLAKTLGRPVAVICPKIVIPSWEREMAETGLQPLFVSNYEKLRNGRTEWMSKAGKKMMRWNLPQGTLVLLDESHKCKSPYTQNAQMMISLVAQGHSVHAMSATAAEDPTEMRALGYALQLHSLNKPVDGLKSWMGWMLAHHCAQNEWGQWELRKPDGLRAIHRTMYGINAKRLTVSDFPESFRDNRIFVEPIAFSDSNKIVKAYADAGITPEIVEKFIEEGTVEDSDHLLVNMLRARQLAESFKVHDLAQMAEDLWEQGNSVVLFVNFRETATTLCAMLNCPSIMGGQHADQRQSVIDSFQRDETQLLVVNIAAGGTGVSLHDVNGVRPRVALICPTFNVKDHLQALGRIHRNGAKSDAVQKILIASGSVEEAVMKAMDRKIYNMSLLHHA